VLPTSSNKALFRNKVITGVKAGVDLVKTHLTNIANAELFKIINNTEKSIIGGIQKFAVEYCVYNVNS
jgi:hypothetical protein